MTALREMQSLKIWQKINIGSPRSSQVSSKARPFNCAAAKAISLIALVSAVVPSQAIILYGSGDPETNTTPPPATLAANGWDLQGQWSIFQGTPIGPHHFVTAAHINGGVGQIFTFHGVDFTTISTSIDSASDLQIFEVAGTFPTWAELYDGPTETGADLVVFGRGAIRGAEVRVNGA